MNSSIQCTFSSLSYYFEIMDNVKRMRSWLGLVAHTYNPSTLGGEAETSGSPEIRSLRPDWPTWWNPVSTKNTKISQAWWCMPVMPAASGAEAGESLEPGRRRLQWAEIMPLHSSLATKWESVSKKKQNKTKYKQTKNSPVMALKGWIN